MVKIAVRVKILVSEPAVNTEVLKPKLEHLKSASKESQWVTNKFFLFLVGEAAMFPALGRDGELVYIVTKFHASLSILDTARPIDI